jgi:poly(3-hydroxyalkanoate) synthetase
VKQKNDDEQRISPDSLLALMGYSPADNREGYETAVHWKSDVVGRRVRALFQWEKILESVSEYPLFFGPITFMAHWQKALLKLLLTGPIRVQARIATRTGRSPDVFSEHNQQIESAYAGLLYDLCGFFMKDGNFDMEKARCVSSTPEGKEFLTRSIREFAWLEYSYNSLGLTRLKAMKEMLQCLLMVITETPLEGQELPCMRKNKEGTFACSFDEYLAELRTRLEGLYRENAFDIITFSERVTQGKLGYSRYEIVDGSKLHSATLRHYPLPEGIQPSGEVLYMVTPLINKPEIFDLAEGKSVVEGMLKEGHAIYLVDHGEPGPKEIHLGLDFYGKILHDKYLELITQRHPGQKIFVMAYCMGGTLILPYLARRAQERMARGESMDIKEVVLMASPVKFDDAESGHGPMRETIRQSYDAMLMRELFGEVNIPPQVIEMGMQEIQPGVQYNVASGFYGRALFPGAIKDSASFLYWLNHGTKFSAWAHEEWITKIFMDNQLYNGTYCLPSSVPQLDGKPVDMDALRKAGVCLFNYRGERDPISPVGSCVASEIWGQPTDGNIDSTQCGLNRTIEKNVGHIFVVSKKLLAEYLENVSAFFDKACLP